MSCTITWRRLGARFWTEAKVAAELIDRGRYPGARPASQKGKWVRGELFELRQPARDLRVLDEVEGFIPGAAEQSEFVRAVAEVILNNGARQRAWIYWLGVSPWPLARSPAVTMSQGRRAQSGAACTRGRGKPQCCPLKGCEGRGPLFHRLREKRTMHKCEA